MTRGPCLRASTHAAVLATAFILVAPVRADDAAAKAPLPIGVSYSGWSGGFRDAAAKIEGFRAVGFPIVTFVPAYAYVGRNKVELTSGPSAEELGHAVEAALRAGRQVVIKPHLEPLLNRPGYVRAQSTNHSWRAECGWRGFFDVDPMTPDYREGIVFSGLRMLKEVFARLDVAGAPRAPDRIRFDLGAELMNSEVAFPERWEQLGKAARAERHRLGLDGRVLLSHNFTHHFEIAEDHVDRMTPAGRKALGRYIAGLDALAISQYMDLTVAVPAGERGQRLPTVDEVAEALRTQELAFRRDILVHALGLKPAQIPPLQLGEFGVGSGGLKDPNLYFALGTPAQESALAREIARGHEGLVRYLSQAQGRTAQSAVLWVTGPHYDIFGWGNPAWAIPDAAAAIRAGLKSAIGAQSTRACSTSDPMSWR